MAPDVLLQESWIAVPITTVMAQFAELHASGRLIAMGLTETGLVRTTYGPGGVGAVFDVPLKS